jgi:phosphoglycerate dehydrogenase-like enzyme
LAYDVIKNAPVPYVTLSELLKKSDVISVHIPLLPSTRHLIGARELALMKQGSLLVNTSRGAIIDEKALVRCISKFWAVCLDVVENEDKFTKSNPLLKFKNVIITPHIGFYTDDSIKRIVLETQKCIIKYTKGNKEGRII